MEGGEEEISKRRDTYRRYHTCETQESRVGKEREGVEHGVHEEESMHKLVRVGLCKVDLL